MLRYTNTNTYRQLNFTLGDIPCNILKILYWLSSIDQYLLQQNQEYSKKPLVRNIEDRRIFNYLKKKKKVFKLYTTQSKQFCWAQHI